MNALIRTAIVALIGGLLSVSVLGLRLACSPRNAQEIRREEELQRLERATLHCREARRKVVHEWIAQQCSLAETMARFQELEQEWPSYSTLLRETMWESDEKRRYRLIISYVEAILQRRPEELATVLRRLEKEYQQFQASRQTPSTAEVREDEG